MELSVLQNLTVEGIIAPREVCRHKGIKSVCYYFFAVPAECYHHLSAEEKRDWPALVQRTLGPNLGIENAPCFNTHQPTNPLPLRP
jgi:hypothetical protein